MHVVKSCKIAYNETKENLKSKESRCLGMNLARVSSNGQITVPVEIRRKLNIKEGDKIIFLENSNGEIILQNSSKIAIREAQAALKDIKVSEEDILQEVMELRYSKGE